MENKLRKHINKRFRLYPKTTEILEVREELFSIMVDKYRDCLEAGKTEDQSFQEATDMMVDYKEAIAEVESGSSHSALRRMLVSVAAFTTFYFVALTGVYLFASMVVVRSFERTWLLAVAGAFLYLVYFAFKAYQYAKLFNLTLLARCGIGLIYLSMIPVFYVFPSLYVSVMGGWSIWAYSWVIILFILCCYITADVLLYRHLMSRLQRDLHLVGVGLILTTLAYLLTSFLYGSWSTGWILYVAYLALVSLLFYLREKKEGRNPYGHH